MAVGGPGAHAELKETPAQNSLCDCWAATHAGYLQHDPILLVDKSGFFIFLFFIFVFYKNIFLIWKFAGIYPGRPAAGRPGPGRPAAVQQGNF